MLTALPTIDSQKDISREQLLLNTDGYVISSSVSGNVQTLLLPYVLVTHGQGTGSGLEVALAIRKIRPDLPVVIILGFVNDELLEGALAAGVQEVVHKPNSGSELVDSIGRLLQA